jgi:CHAD domain-containing protein
MGFYLEKDEDSAVGLQRILRDQSAHLIADLRNENREEAIHEARKGCKRVRAVFRLLRFTAAPLYRRENRAFGSLARALSEMRDADAQIEAFRELVKLEKNGPAHYATLGHLLRETNRHFPVIVQKHKLAAMAAQARAARERLEHLQLPEGRGFELIEKGLWQSYRRGRKAMTVAFDRSEGTAFHEWRKRVKDLGYQIHLLRRLWPRMLKGLQDELEELGALLGQEHDLRVMREGLLKNTRKTISSDLHQSFFGLLERRTFELQSEAHALGRRLYAEGPKAFMKRMSVYWRTWRTEIPSSSDHGKPALLPRHP